ncbi:unnamed protein product [Didymodactylos carnosus]|uniref:Uncharacterized protein n=1 Tax=Didymodactylos carnosus TaxID=1234261 RepID=A0A815B004_9BILA|nr:unnamed protein product [Didymodactylos carnosus]CAF1415732.1 unnamed protein product [Didymodactylos carnosus]CAF4043359.1 unnamed protein product [Didymodactylos carnosus]CAF4220418.1 unnamed protein product [Didymodactylos carnosus]
MNGALIFLLFVCLINLCAGYELENSNHFTIHSTFLTFGRDYSVITDEKNDNSTNYNIRYKWAENAGKTLTIENNKQEVIYEMRHRLLHYRAHWDITNENGKLVGEFKHKFSALHHNFDIITPSGTYNVRSESLLSHEFKMTKDGKLVATISKEWFTFGGTYHLDVVKTEDPAFVIVITICIDETINH